MAVAVPEAAVAVPEAVVSWPEENALLDVSEPVGVLGPLEPALCGAQAGFHLCLRSLGLKYGEVVLPPLLPVLADVVRTPHAVVVHCTERLLRQTAELRLRERVELCLEVPVDGGEVLFGYGRCHDALPRGEN